MTSPPQPPPPPPSFPPENQSPIRGWSNQKFLTVMVALGFGAFIFWCCMCSFGSYLGQE